MSCAKMAEPIEMPFNRIWTPRLGWAQGTIHWMRSRSRHANTQLFYRKGHAWTCATTLLWSRLPFAWIHMRPRKHALHRDAYWRHLTNTIEPSVFGGTEKRLTWLRWRPFACGLGWAQEPCVRWGPDHL